MTATMTADGLTVHHVELSGRRAYVARLAGTHPTYGFDREWCDRVKTINGRRGWWAKITRPGWYEAVTYGQTGLRRTRYYANDGRTLEEIPPGIAATFLVHAFAGPPPGQPGAWRGDACHCGTEVAWFTPAGFPRCSDHHDPTEHAEHSHATQPTPDTGPAEVRPF